MPSDRHGAGVSRRPLTAVEQLAAQFSRWERRGRGWQLYPYCVDIEPPFTPFLFHGTPPPPPIDDGRIPTIGSRIIDRLSGRREPEQPAQDSSYIEEEDIEPLPADERTDLACIRIAVPPDWKSQREVGRLFLTALAHTRLPVSFEIVGTANDIRAQFSCDRGDGVLLAGALRSHLPDVAMELGTDEGGMAAQRLATFVVDFGLSNEFMLPIRAAGSFDPDPLIPFITGMELLHESEVAVFQVLFRAVRNPWAESILRAVLDDDGKPFFADAAQLASQAKAKVSQPLWAAMVRIGAASQNVSRAREIARRIATGIAQFKEPLGNEFMPLANDDYPDEVHWADFLLRTSHRPGMILNADELMSLVHAPSVSVRSPKLIRYTKKTKAAPEAVTRAGIMLGENAHQGSSKVVRIGPAERMRHTYLIGASGTGKSNLLLNMMVQDIEAGEGMGLLDPHGDLADEVLARIPESRLKDVILFDPSDEERPVAWNILQAHSPLEKTLLSSDMGAAFKRLSTSWGDQMTSVLGNAVLAILESTRGGSIGDLRRFLVDADWRKEFLQSVTDPEIVFYWQKEFPLLQGRPQASVLTRLDTFLRPRPVRAMVTARKDRLDFRAVIDERKIFIAKLAQGAIGEENSSLLGSLLVSKFHQVASSRQDALAASRAHFYLYLDEFHHFVTPTMASLLSGARKYRLGLTLAHQDMRQLVSRDPDVAAAVIANPCTRICFRVGEADARTLKESFSFFDGKDLQNLGVGEAIVRVERSDWDFNLRTVKVGEVAPELAAQRREAALAHSRSNYGVPLAPVPAASVPPEAGPAVVTEPAKEEAQPTRKRSAAARKETSEPAEPVPAPGPLGGRGGPQHKYLQDLIRRWAEDRGYRVTIEKPVLDGLGTVDVVIEKAGRAPIACEISVTTSSEHELGNAQKCLAAGFENVFLVAPDHETLSRVRERASKVLNARQMKAVRFVLPEQVFAAVSVLESRPAAPERPAPAAGEEVLTAKEVEELLRLDVKTIYRYVQNGKMPYVRVQSNLRFIKSEVLAWFKGHGGGGPPEGRK